MLPFNEQLLHSTIYILTLRLIILLYLLAIKSSFNTEILISTVEVSMYVYVATY